MTLRRTALQTALAETGAVSVERFMALALQAPDEGYYRRRDPLGRAGDFITAPEISQTFGELIGAWCAVVWQQMGQPARFRLVELGPGRGTLLADALRATANLALFQAALELHLVETSTPLRARQKAALGQRLAYWHEQFESLPSGPLIVLANEFFDALPIRQFIATETGWRERLVAPAGAGFRFVLAKETTAPAAAPTLDPARYPAGTIAETAPARTEMMARIATRIGQAGGAALVIDYGHAKSAAGDTLQAVKQHRAVPVLAEPGEADLTAHVDFAALKGAAEAAAAIAYGPRRQGDFLRSLGIEARAARLRNAAGTPAQAEAVDRGVQRLIGAEAMGHLFKVLALTAPGQLAPPGFETAASQATSREKAAAG
jgi:NADH dehydrogenase [ubiquinone] 1 alpha subcomplex assembly factor 7